MGDKPTLKSLSEDIEALRMSFDELLKVIGDENELLKERVVNLEGKKTPLVDKQKLLNLCDYADSDSQDVLRAIIDIIA